MIALGCILHFARGAGFVMMGGGKLTPVGPCQQEAGEDRRSRMQLLTLCGNEFGKRGYPLSSSTPYILRGLPPTMAL